MKKSTKRKLKLFWKKTKANAKTAQLKTMKFGEKATRVGKRLNAGGAVFIDAFNYNPPRKKFRLI